MVVDSENTSDNQDSQIFPDAEEIAEDDVLEVIEINDDGAARPDGEEDEDEEMGEAEVEAESGPDNSVLRFARHSEPVFCVATHPLAPDICASGAADDLGYIWSAATGAEILQLSGHQDSLAAVEFSHDGQLLATGSVDGTVKIWQATDRETFSKWEFLLDLEASEEVTWLSWHPKGLVLLAGCSDGMVFMWQLPSGTTMQVFAGHDSMTTCGTFTPDGKTIVTGSESGVLIVWNPRDGSALQKVDLNEGRYGFRSPDGPSGINALVVNQASTLCVAGGIANGAVRLISVATGALVGALDEHERAATVDVAIFEPSAGVPLLVSAGTDGLACIYDAATFKLRNSARHQDPITTLVIHKDSGRFTTGCLDKSLITWDLRSAEVVQRHFGHHDVVHMVKLTCDSKRLVSCSDDGTALVFGITQESMT